MTRKLVIVFVPNDSFFIHLRRTFEFQIFYYFCERQFMAFSPLWSHSPRSFALYVLALGRIGRKEIDRERKERKLYKKRELHKLQYKKW